MAGTGTSSSVTVEQQPFAIVTQNLFTLNAFPLETLVRSPKADLEGFDLPFVDSHNDFLSSHPSLSQFHSSGTGTGTVAGVIASTLGEQQVSLTMQNVAKLHQICQQAFGNSEALKFEFLEDQGVNQKQCILTIARPDGLSRSYTTKPEFGRKSDAKAYAAALAIELGAIDFILYGNKDSKGKRGVITLAPLDAKVVSHSSNDDVPMDRDDREIEDEESQQIEERCNEWRAGKVKPQWLFYDAGRGGDNYGCVLLVELSPHSHKAYSVSATYGSQALAKNECSQLAIKQGVLEFIQFGNGQTAPAPRIIEQPELPIVRETTKVDERGRPQAMTLQAFFDSIPKPFPEPVGDKSASELNAPGMLNTIVQLAKGARMSLHYHFLTESKSALHGCVLRLERPGESRSYVVLPRFSKRADAKAAVCLRAMSLGIGDYVRTIASAIENKVNAEMRRMANEVILPILGSEYAKLRQGMHPSYEFDHDLGAFGCTMIIMLESEPKPEEVRKWVVPTEFRTKNDAKVAVVCLGGREAIEFIRFRGGPIPPDHDPLKPYRRPKQLKPTVSSNSGRDSTPSIKAEEGEIVMREPSSSNDKNMHPKSSMHPDSVVGLIIEDAEKLRPPKRSRVSRAAEPKSTLTEQNTRHPLSNSRHVGPSHTQQLSTTFVPPNPSAVAAAATAVIDRLTTATPDSASAVSGSDLHQSHLAHTNQTWMSEWHKHLEPNVATGHPGHHFAAPLQPSYPLLTTASPPFFGIPPRLSHPPIASPPLVPSPVIAQPSNNLSYNPQFQPNVAGPSSLYRPPDDISTPVQCQTPQSVPLPSYPTTTNVRGSGTKASKRMRSDEDKRRRHPRNNKSRHRDHDIDELESPEVPAINYGNVDDLVVTNTDSELDKLYDYCRAHGIPTPKVSEKRSRTDKAKEGKARLAEKVLKRLKSQVENC